jgi:hypothetical protein
MAWAVNHAHGTTVWDSETQARKAADEWLASRVWVWAEVVPLCRSPALTDEERQAMMRAMYRVVGADSAILWSLLERTK